MPLNVQTFSKHLASLNVTFSCRWDVEARSSFFVSNVVLRMVQLDTWSTNSDPFERSTSGHKPEHMEYCERTNVFAFVILGCCSRWLLQPAAVAAGGCCSRWLFQPVTQTYGLLPFGRSRSRLNVPSYS